MGDVPKKNNQPEIDKFLDLLGQIDEDRLQELLEHVEVSALDEMRLVGFPPLFTDKRKLRYWWHQLLGNYGKYSCCAFLLVLPSDKDAINYFTEFGSELDQLSGENCLIIVLSGVHVKGPGIQGNYIEVFENEDALQNHLTDLSKFDLERAIEEQVAKGYSVKVAEYFEVGFEEFPCLIVFEDIRSTRHIVVSLKGLNTEQMAAKLRRIFSAIQKGVSKKQEPLVVLKGQLKKEAGVAVAYKIRSFAEKTYEIAVTALVVGTTTSPQ
jgi:hypothetical protein